MKKDITVILQGFEKRIKLLESKQEFLFGEGVVYQDLHGVIIRNGDIVKVNPQDDDWYELVIEYNGSLVLASELRSTFKAVTDVRLRDMVYGCDNPVEIVANLWNDNIKIEKIDYNET